MARRSAGGERRPSPGGSSGTWTITGARCLFSDGGHGEGSEVCYNSAGNSSDYRVPLPYAQLRLRAPDLSPRPYWQAELERQATCRSDKQLYFPINNAAAGDAQVLEGLYSRVLPVDRFQRLTAAPEERSPTTPSNSAFGI